MHDCLRKIEQTSLKMVKIIVIRMRGRINVPPDIKRTLDMLRLRKKFSCVILDDKPETIGKLKKIQNYIAYGQVKEETIKQLLLKRAKPPLNEKIVDAFIKEFMEGKKKIEDLKIKKFFSLHPPRGGFRKDTRKSWPEGILGNNKKINELVMKML